MAAGGHFGFWPLLGLAHTFARGIRAQFFFKYLKVSKSTLKPSSALGGHGSPHGRSKYDPTSRENVVVTCKIGSFLCSLDNLLHKNIIVFFFENQISKWQSSEKRAIFDLFFTFISYQGKGYKNSISTYLTHTHICILLTQLTFFALLILKKIQIYQVWFLFGMIPGVDSYSRHLGQITKW